MRAFVTGGTGFIGSRVVAQLRARGDDVVALVRTPAKASELKEFGCELIQGDLADQEALRAGAEGADAVFHLAAVYAIGVPAGRRDELIDSAVSGTEAVLDAAAAAGVKRTLYVSTVNVFGNTHGRVVDESYRRNLGEGFVSVYDEAKYRAHQVAEQRIAAGAPVVIVQPGGVYGAGDHSEIGNMIEQTRRGLTPLIPFGQMGFCMVHVDDVARGIVAAFDQGRNGESYVLAGDTVTMKELVQLTARLSGRRIPRHSLPTALIKASAPFGPLVGPLLGFPPNLKELISASDGVTYWASDAKARAELGFQTRPLTDGLADLIKGG